MHNSSFFQIVARLSCLSSLLLGGLNEPSMIWMRQELVCQANTCEQSMRWWKLQMQKITWWISQLQKKSSNLDSSDLQHAQFGLELSLPHCRFCNSWLYFAPTLTYLRVHLLMIQHCNSSYSVWGSNHIHLVSYVEFLQIQNISQHVFGDRSKYWACLRSVVCWQKVACIQLFWMLFVKKMNWYVSASYILKKLSQPTTHQLNLFWVLLCFDEWGKIRVQ